MSFFETDPFGRACRECGCDDAHACYDPANSGGCHWVTADLCSRCAGQANGHATPAYGAAAPLSARVAAAAYVGHCQSRRRVRNRWWAAYAACAAIPAIAWVLS